MRKADKNKDNKMNFKEVKDFLKELNVQVDDSYARKIFRVSLARCGYRAVGLAQGQL